MGHRSLTTKPTYALGIWRRLMTVLGRLDSTEAGYLLRVEKFKHVSCLWKWSRRWTDKSRCMHWHRSIYTRLWWSSEALNGVSASLLRRLLPWPGPRQSVREYATVNPLGDIVSFSKYPDTRRETVPAPVHYASAALRIKVRADCVSLATWHKTLHHKMSPQMIFRKRGSDGSSDLRSVNGGLRRVCVFVQTREITQQHPGTRYGTSCTDKRSLTA